MGREKLGVVLLQLGGPDSLDAVRPFLENLFSDPDMIDIPLGKVLLRPLSRVLSRRRAPVVIERYRKTGAIGSLERTTDRQARALEARLSERYDAVVTAGMRYWRPTIDDAIGGLRLFEPERVVLLPLFPQYSRTTTGSCFREWDRCKKVRGFSPRAETRIASYCDHPRYIGALAEAIGRGLEFFGRDERDKVHILFSAHGLPVRYVEKGDPYEGEVRRTVKAVLETLRPPNPCSLAFQSRMGPLRWLRPSVREEVERLAGEGVRAVIVVPVSFVSDHLETLYDLGIDLREHALRHGIERFHVIPALNDSQVFIGALTEIVIEKLESA